MEIKKNYDSLKKNSDFQNVYVKGKSKANRYLVMYVAQNNLSINRLGISVSKKVGNSVVRHHLTRLIREAYRLNSNMFNSSLDIVVIARNTAKDKTYKEVEKMLKLESKEIPADLDYDKVVNLASEARQKLKKVAPKTIAQAMRISGVNPADISILSIYLRKEYNRND